MNLTKHALNGVISLAISVAATAAMRSGDDSYTASDVLVAVGLSAFLSGAFTSYFASK